MKLNIASNYAQQAVNIGLRFFMIPVYVEAFGLGAYGLIGFYISLSSIFVLLDFGMGYASIKLLSESNSATRENDTAVLRFAEKIYLGCALLIGFSVYFLAGLIAENWLTVDIEGGNSVVTIQLMALLLLVNWPQSLYQSFLMGQQRFVVMNAAMIMAHITVAVVMFFGITNYDLGVNYYFVVMAVVMFLQTLGLRHLAWINFRHISVIPATRKDIKRFFSYSAGVSVFSLCSLGFFQGPLLTLSYLSPTSELGLYNLAMTFPMAFITLMYPLGSVFLPKLARVSENDDAQRKFENATFIMGSFITVGIVTLVMNMEWVYLFWLGAEASPVQLGSVSKSLAFGTFFYGLAMVMNNVLLINGATKPLSAAYIAALLWFCLKIYLSYESVSAQTIANLWMEVSFVAMCGVVLAGLVSFPQLRKGWLNNIVLVFGLGLIGILVILGLSTNDQGGSFINLVLTISIMAALYLPKTYKAVKAL